MSESALKILDLLLFLFGRKTKKGNAQYIEYSLSKILHYSSSLLYIN